VVGIYADEMGVGPSGSNNKKRFSRNLQVLVQEEEVTWLEEKAKAMTVTYSGGSVCKKRHGVLSVRVTFLVHVVPLKVF